MVLLTNNYMYYTYILLRDTKVRWLNSLIKLMNVDVFPIPFMNNA
jgi:hypothetical protein